MGSDQIKDILLTHRCERDEKYFQVYDEYRPDYNKTIVTGKFYSKYDVSGLDSVNQEIIANIKKVKDTLPRDKYPWSITTSHMYGWFDPVESYDRNDWRFYAPCAETPYIKHEIKLRQDKTMKLEKFSGIPFKV